MATLVRRCFLKRNVYNMELAGTFRRLSTSAAPSQATSTPISERITVEKGPRVKPTSEEIVKILRTCQAVCFDVDSTVIPEEGIDELAAFKGVGEAVADWTKRAMGGQVLFQDALTARLGIIQPSRSDVTRYLEERSQRVDATPRLTPGVRELVDKLHNKGKIVYLVSGGFRQMIEPVADILGIPSHRVYANTLLFDTSSGAFAGFDVTEPTSMDGGKTAVVQRLIDAHGYGPVVMIGDGATDMQAVPPADLFIGFGGVVEREIVRTGADLYVTDFQHIVDLLES